MSANSNSRTASSTNDCQKSEIEFKTAIEDFERCLVRPILAGELSTWVEDLQRAWTEFGAQIHFRSKHLNPRVYREIGEQDPELLPRIDLLKAEDSAIDEQRENINQEVWRIAQHIPKLEPDEEKAQKHLQSLIDSGTSFVTRVRKQAIAIQTWYVEAFNRDRGAVD